MTKLIFIWYLINGTIQPTQESVEGERMYNIHLKKEQKVIEYAYKNEVINWIETKEFKYDDYCQGKN
jgi:hypothetical protein